MKIYFVFIEKKKKNISVSFTIFINTNFKYNFFESGFGFLSGSDLEPGYTTPVLWSTNNG